MSDDGTITLADGTVINTVTGQPVRQNNGVPAGYNALPTNSEALRDVTRVRRRVSDLPDVPERMNIIGAVAAYYLFGLDEYETAIALGCSQSQVERIKMTEAFDKLIADMQQRVVEAQQEDVRGMLSAASRDAVDTMLGAMRSENEQVAVVAAKDVLDRSGHRPVDVVEHRHKVEGGLTIEYVKKGGEDTLPALDMKAVEEVDDDGS